METNNDEKRIHDIEKFADLLITTSADDIFCKEHIMSQNDLDCNQCKKLKECVNKYQNHNHTFTCRKKRKQLQ